jgi:hypothetical protein
MTRRNLPTDVRGLFLSRRYMVARSSAPAFGVIGGPIIQTAAELQQDLSPAA